MDEINEEVDRETGKVRQRRWDALMTGAILVWLGLVVLAGVGWSAGLLGVGVILLLEQALQWRWNATYDGFYLSAGAIALIAGGAGVASIDVPVVAIALIVAGLWTARTALRSRAKR